MSLFVLIVIAQVHVYGTGMNGKKSNSTNRPHPKPTHIHVLQKQKIEITFLFMKPKHVSLVWKERQRTRKMFAHFSCTVSPFGFRSLSLFAAVAVCPSFILFYVMLWYFAEITTAFLLHTHTHTRAHSIWNIFELLFCGLLVIQFSCAIRCMETWCVFVLLLKLP